MSESEYEAAHAGPPVALRLARHLVALVAVACLGHYVFDSPDSIVDGFVTSAIAVGAATALYGAFWLFFTNQAKEGVVRPFIAVAWIVVAIVLYGARLSAQRIVDYAPQGSPAASREPDQLKPSTLAIDDFDAVSQRVLRLSTTDAGATQNPILAAHPDVESLVVSLLFDAYLRDHPDELRTAQASDVYGIAALLGRYRSWRDAAIPPYPETR